MSRTTREINRITTTIIGLSTRLLLWVLVVFLLYEGVTKGYSLGHAIFSETTAEAAPGHDVSLIIEEGESALEVGARLEEDGLIENRLIFLIQSKFYDYEIYPGTYTLNTSMTVRDMLQLIDGNAQGESTDDGDSE